MAAAAQSGALTSAGVRKLYLPTALLKEHLPSGMASLGRVPRLNDSQDASYAVRLQEYVSAIRATARVFEQDSSLETTRARYDRYMCWVDSWAKLSGFDKLAVIDNEVCLPYSMSSMSVPARDRDRNERSGCTSLVPASHVGS